LGHRVDSLCAGESVSASDFAMFEVQMALSEEGDGKGGFPAWGIPPGGTLEFTLECLEIK